MISILSKTCGRFTAFVLCVAVSMSAAVRAQYSVTATVIDPDGEPEEYATYRIYAIPDTLRPIMGDVTDDMGVINVTLPRQGDYRLSVAAAMRLPVTVDFTVTPDSPQADLGILNTRNAGEMLNEITVSAQRPLVTKEIDRIGYDVTADADASTSNLREIMRKVPLVTVDDDGTIKVNGSSDFKIYRNGRPNNAFTKNAKDIFAAIPASSIKKIEVITDPGAREDAESSGVILNIVTTSTVSMTGVSGNVGASWRSNMGPQLNAFIMTQVKKLTLSASGGYYKYLPRYTRGDQKSTTEYLESGNRSESDLTFTAGGQGAFFNVEGSLELDTLNLLTASVNGYVGKNSHDLTGTFTMFDGTTPLYSYAQSSYYPKNGYTDIDFSLDYQRLTRLKGESLTLSYRLSHTRQDQDQKTLYTDKTNAPFFYDGINSNFDLKFFEHTFQFDWTRPLGRHFVLDTGAKYILRSSHSNNNQLLWVGADPANNRDSENEFEHRYHIFGLYGDVRANFGRWTARAGLRYEYSRLGADFIRGEGTDFHSNLNDVVPNVSVAWHASQSSMWKLTFNRRIQRPGISYLNPAVTNTPTSVSYGNPDLKSMSLNNLLLNYSLIKAKFNMDLTATYAFADNGTGSRQWVTPDNITYSTYDNILQSRNFNLSAFVQWQITDKTSFMLNGMFGYASYKIDTDTEYASLGKWNGYFFARVQQRLPWELTLSGMVNYFSGWCTSPYSYMTSPASAIGYSLMLKRSFLKNKTLDVSVQAENMGLPGRKSNQFTLNNGTEGYSVTTQSHRFGLTVSVAWRFGNLRAQVKKAASTITNDDLEGRKN